MTTITTASRIMIIHRAVCECVCVCVWIKWMEWKIMREITRGPIPIPSSCVQSRVWNGALWDNNGC